MPSQQCQLGMPRMVQPLALVLQLEVLVTCRINVFSLEEQSRRGIPEKQLTAC